MKGKSILLLGAAMLMPVVLGACPGINRGQTIFLDVQKNGANVTAQVGDHLVVELRSNPSTGFSWHVTTIDSASLESVQQQFIFDNTDDVAGAPGTTVLEFAAIAAGSSTLTLDYVQAGAPVGTPPAQTYSLGVLVE